MRLSLGGDWYVRVLAISNRPNLLITQPCILDSEVIHNTLTVLTALFILVISINLHYGTTSPIPASESHLFCKGDPNSDFIALSGQKSCVG
jgi:hypothetical protein